MAAQFYVANAAATGATVVVSSAAGAPALILPAGATVVSVAINDAGTGNIDLGTSGYTSGTTSATAIANNLSAAAGTTSIGSVVSGTALTEMSYVTSTTEGGSGTVGGYLIYFVADPLVGQQNV